MEYFAAQNVCICPINLIKLTLITLPIMPFENTINTQKCRGTIRSHKKVEIRLRYTYKAYTLISCWNTFKQILSHPRQQCWNHRDELN